MKIRVIWPGKTKQKYLREAIADYAARISKLSPFEIVETREESRTDKKRVDRLRKESRHILEKASARVTVVLDSEGKRMSSVQFSQWLQRQSTDIDFLVGGPEGLQSSGHALVLSLGSFTLPHELARVVLLEQIYRALTIIKRIPYHK